MRANGPVNPAAAGQPAGRGPAGPARAGGSPAAVVGAVLRAPFTGWAWRELLFCAIEVPLGFCVLVFPVALAGLPLAVALLVHGGPRLSGSAPAHRSAVVTVVGGVVLAILVALLVLAPRIARGLGAAHRRLAARLLGEDIPGPPAIRRGLKEFFCGESQVEPKWSALSRCAFQMKSAFKGVLRSRNAAWGPGDCFFSKILSLEFANNALHVA
jgi:hypothetical protein